MSSYNDDGDDDKNTNTNNNNYNNRRKMFDITNKIVHEMELGGLVMSSSYCWKEGVEALEFWTSTGTTTTTTTTAQNMSLVQEEESDNDDDELMVSAQQQQQQKENREQSCRLLERLLEERQYIQSRFEKVYGEIGASKMLDASYALDTNEIIRRIVTNHHHHHHYNHQIRFEEEKEHHHQQQQQEKDNNEHQKETTTTSKTTTVGNPLLQKQAQQQNQNEEKKKLASWVQDLVDRFGVHPCQEVVSMLKIEVAEQEKTKQYSTSNENGKVSQTDKQAVSYLRTMGETQDNKLAGSILLNFVRTCNTAGIDYDATQERVNQYIKSRQQQQQQKQHVGRRRRHHRHHHHHHQVQVQESKSKQAYLFVLKSWEDIALGHQIAAKHGDKILYEMLTTYLEQNNLDVKPCRECFASVISIHSTRGDVQATNRVLQDWLRLCKSSSSTGDYDDDDGDDEDFIPDRRSFVRVLLLLFQSTSKIRRRRRSIQDGSRQDGSSSSSSSSSAATALLYMADDVLRNMLDLAIAKQDPLLVPPQSVFQHMLTLWSQSYQKDSGERAEAILLRRQQQQQELLWWNDSNEILSMNDDPGSNNNLPPLKFFQLVMQSHANSYMGKKGALRVEKVLSIVKSHFGTDINNNNSNANNDEDDGEDGLLPPSFGFLQLIQAWSRATDASHEEALQFVELYFRQFRLHFGSKDVSSIDIFMAYRARIDAWENLCAGAPTKSANQCQTIFDDLMKLREGGIVTQRPDVKLFGSLANVWAKAGNVERVKDILAQMSDETGETPNTRAYNSLLLALSRSKEPSAATQAEELLSEMERLSAEGDTKVKPNSRSYGTVVQALANSPDPARAELYLEKLKEVYEASRDEDGNKDETLSPNTFIYNNTILAMAKQRSKEATEKAQVLLDEMLELARQGDEKAKPDAASFNLFLRLLRTADIPNKLRRRRETLSLMEQNGVKPNYYTSNELKQKW